MKTILITIFHPFITKNILNTDVFKVLSGDKNLRIILVVPELKESFFKDNYEKDKVLVVGVRNNQLLEEKNTKFLSRLSHLLIDANYPTYKRHERLDASDTPIAYVKFFGETVLTKLLSGKRFINKIVRKYALNSVRHREIVDLFDEYKPNTVFSTDIFDESDCLFAIEAKRRKIFLVGMVRSWDNCYSKGLMRVIPDKLIVNNETIKEEAISMHQVPKEYISILGSPQYDIFINNQRTPHEVFFKSMNLDPLKKLITFAPAGRILSNTDGQTIEMLKKGIDTGKFKYPVQFLIRNHPNHPADVSAIVDRKDMVVEDPGKAFNKNPKDTELTLSDTEHMADELFYSDIVMWVATTLGMDAIVFDKPQIAVDFDGYEKKPYYKSVRRYHDEDHMKKMLALGGVTVVMSEDELINAINRYLVEPSLHKEGRELVRKQQFYGLDGKAGERIGQYLVTLAQSL
ncbi:MAG: hypothetical protein A2920_02720 [Candidatus Zambryskibacteria bacterium RIFCSPLOWO2_01_FULL_43_17]|uniref:UDP-N-acetylglucosamine 2-epimerase domain-containing protein n=1 Tax=Candidatus Zambryskibacteria bacterium RIFCSPLOWO2_01_FULL_43_17 TaxID=1802760 RepID=A0A1G2U1Z4_9BACT|nr:MAG: hypothetical protein A2920_02720 [Candidatus Zambryskibacteria bacterium RIFCSPLOWO2_01_FULL_43_17]